MIKELFETLMRAERKNQTVTIISRASAKVVRIHDVKINGYGYKIWLSCGYTMLIPHGDYVNFEQHGDKKFFFVTSNDSPSFVTTFIF